MLRQGKGTYDWAGESGAGLLSPLPGESGEEEVLELLAALCIADDGSPYTSGAVRAVGGAMVTPLMVMPPMGLVLHPVNPQLLVGVPLSAADSPPIV